MSVEGDETLELTNVRMPHFTEAEIETAEREQVKRAGPLVTRMKARIDESWSVVRTDLAERAGGTVSIRAQLLGHYALKANMALELQALMAEGLAGRDKEGSDKAFRSLAGLSVVAADLLNKAYAAATEEGKAKAAKLGPVDQLMTTLGVQSETGGQGERSEVGPTLHGGGGSNGEPPRSKSTASLPLGPLSQPKPTPAAPAPESPSVFAAPQPKKPPRRKQEP